MPFNSVDWRHGKLRGILVNAVAPCIETKNSSSAFIVVVVVIISQKVKDCPSRSSEITSNLAISIL